ncbi:receptor-like protein kinase FERONIA [Prosopis cineraria]|uniref:receptor-like protein kinase FERONIA n=1 Tax=Prosopis cineraria TaxID=364024 RepID=UPI00240F261B|nr:receptor-like protein kinase FERONIA [Prosopis cineraria]
MAVWFLLLFLFIQILSTTGATSYTPVDHFAVNCGDFGYTLWTHRNWTGDIGSTLFSLIESYNTTHSVKAHAPVRKVIPYGTARFSHFEFSYSFPVTHGPKFVRLHFHRSSYQGFLHYDSLFSVKAGSHYLLKNFNTSLAADHAGQETILQEYFVNVEPGHRLNITFMPSLSHPKAYAFINGIEVVSMPTFLYYTNLNNPHGMLLFGGRKFSIKNNSALETLYRINVGGRQILPIEDTGMFRNWDPDNPYLERECPYSVSAFFGNSSLTYKHGQNYFAPDVLYQTMRNYGMNETSKFNVTWEFQVDSEFYYMVRLHFCEFDEHIQSVGERVFQIFIDDALVEPVADVMMWSGNQLLVPVHRDYVVSMHGGGILKKLNLSIKLQPHPYARSTYRDVLLNGIEILKIINFRDHVEGSSPNPHPAPLLPSTLPSKTRVISIAVGVASSLVLLSLIVLITSQALARGPVNQGSSCWGQKTLAMPKINKTQGSSFPSDLCRCFSIEEIRAATNNFDDIFILGVGGFGNVYKGFIDDGRVPVAIKRLKQGSQQGLDEFQTEIEMLSQFCHFHLVSLIGYCNDGDEMILVYEFMAGGTLCEHLYNSNNQPLSWNQRLEICLGAARGLHYLHTGAKHAIIHRDIKTTNILLDEKWMAKISDFGLSKVGPEGIWRSNIDVSTMVKGSIGYLDPEYYMCQRLTEKSDVYSFGVVLLEVLCGRPPILRSVERQQQSLVDWVRRCANVGEIHLVVDPFVRESMTPECLKAYTKIALNCLSDDGNERPPMGDVMLDLESMVEMSMKAEELTLGRSQECKSMEISVED